MEATTNGFARRCLPLVIANQAGWVVRLPFEVRVVWDGSDAPGSLDIGIDGDHPARNLVSDHFGWGILTFNVPFVFRTRSGIGLLVRGAPNFWVDGAHPLEGLVETDWATVTFTMNWKLLTPGRTVTFHRDDPVCFLQPIDVRTIEAARPEVVALADRPELAEGYDAWARSRAEFLAHPGRGGGDWQKHYFVGTAVAGGSAPAHRTTVSVAPFAGAPDLPSHLVDGAGPGPVLVKREVTVVEEDEDGFVVVDAAGGRHRLNATAMFVLECCSGDNRRADIVEMARVTFGLDHPPLAAVERCLNDLLRSGLVEAAPGG